MKILRFLSSAGARLGLIEGTEVIDLVSAAQERGQSWLAPMFCDLRLFLASGEGGRAAARSVAEFARHSRHPLDQLQALAPYHAGSKLLAHVVNYYGHDKEAGVKVPSRPFFFLKTPGCVSNPGDSIVMHRWSSKLDHEVELAIVIGKVGRNIPAESAHEYVAGYTVVNDVSYRDLQFNENSDDLNKSYGKNWTQGKGMDCACPMGPILVLQDEMAQPYPLDIICRVNGRVRQQSNTDKMIYKVPALIAEASKGTTLYPGDVIATGTCSGGGLADGTFLKPGDVVECEVQNIGILRNTVIADSPSR